MACSMNSSCTFLTTGGFSFPCFTPTTTSIGNSGSQLVETRRQKKEQKKAASLAAYKKMNIARLRPVTKRRWQPKQGQKISTNSQVASTRPSVPVMTVEQFPPLPETTCITRKSTRTTIVKSSKPVTVLDPRQGQFRKARPVLVAMVK